MSAVHRTAHPLADSDSDLDSSYDFIANPPPQSDFVDYPFKNKNVNSHPSGSKSLLGAGSSAKKPSRLYPISDTVEEMRPEEVRWFYKSPDDKKWIPFIGYDSLRLECKYREIKQISTADSNTEVVKESEEELICVRGSLYEVDVAKKRCYPIYWEPQGMLW